MRLLQKKLLSCSHSNQEKTSYTAQWNASVYHESCHTGQSFSPELYAHHAADWEVSFPPHASQFAKKSGHDCYGSTFLALWQFYIMIALRVTPLKNS